MANTWAFETNQIHAGQVANALALSLIVNQLMKSPALEPGQRP
jgi:hypothetical protein